MKATDRLVIAGIAVLGLTAAFWFFLLSPKREEASTLGDDVAALEASVAEQQELALAAEQARGDFDSDYRELLVLGKAVPESDDTASLFAQLTAVSDRAAVQLRGIELTESTAAPPALPPPPPAEEATTPTEGEPADAAATTAAVPAPATEASAATLPIGATVGAAGLPVMPYSLSFRGDFFEMADFFDGLDDSIHTRGADDVEVSGRLVTVDGFAFKADPRKGFPNLFSNVAVTSYVTPADQGALAGATAGGPAATVPPATATPAAAPVTPPPASATPTTTP